MRQCIALAAILLAGLTSFVSAAGVPNSISYQGRLTTSGGSPVADGTYLIKCVIYDAPAGGTSLWNSQFQSVSTASGLFTMELGAPPMDPLPTTLFNDTVRYVGVTVGVDAEMTPRTRLITVPYAHRAAAASSADAVSWGAINSVPAGFADGIDDNSGGDITDVTAGTGLNGGGTSGSVSLSANTSYLQRRVTGIANAGEAIQGINADGSVITTAVGPGDITAVNTSSGIAGGATSGDVTLTLAGTIPGSHTFSTGDIRFGDSTMMLNQWGIVVGTTSSPSTDYVVYGARSFSSASTKYGYLSDIENASTGSIYAGYFEADRNAAGDGFRYGVYGFANKLSSSTKQTIGVYGESGSGTQTAGFTLGIAGMAFTGAGSTGYGVYGSTAGGGTRYAGYFDGNTHVNGTLSKLAGAFKIDHPLDPANKYLQHSFVESPDMMNIYNGNVTLDANGEAVVTLPSYFQALNMDFRYQLTSIGAPGPNLYIAQKVSGNQFRIAGGASGSEVSWQVTGIRNDRFAHAHRLQVEIDKPGTERGTYLSPEEHDQPISRHVNWMQIKEAQNRQAEIDAKSAASGKE